MMQRACRVSYLYKDGVMAKAVTSTRLQDEQIRELSVAEGWALLDARARRYLGISAQEFIRRWRAGEYPDPDQPEIMPVVMALPFARDEA